MQQYIIPMAKNSATGQTAKVQDLSGRRLQPHEKLECQLLADRLAAQLTFRTGDQWVGFCEPFTPAKTKL